MVAHQRLQLVPRTGRMPTTLRPQTVRAIGRFQDDRKEVTEPGVPTMAMERAASVCAVLPISRIEERRDGKWALSAPTLADFYDVASTEPFRDQPVAAVGTAFLVRRQVIATALHVATRVTSAQELCFVFGYDVRNGRPRTVFDADDVYMGGDILWGHRDEDIALVSLQRPVRGRRALPLRLRAKVRANEKVYVVGYPAGLPAKYADQACVTDNRATHFFKTNLDIMMCNSGSPVFSSDRHDVIGIVSRGPIGFTMYNERLVSYFDQDEDDVLVSRITNLRSSAGWIR